MAKQKQGKQVTRWDADQDMVEAKFKHGVLTITIGKRPEAKPTQVAIKT